MRRRRRAPLVPIGNRRSPEGRLDERLEDKETGGVIADTIVCMAMTLRLDEHETAALRRRAELEGRSMQEVARQAVRDYIERTSKRQLLDRVLDEELPRYAEALERLGQ